MYEYILRFTKFIREKSWLPFLILLASCIAVYANSINAPFELDDFSSIVDNYAIRNPFDFAALWGFYSNRVLLYFTFSINYFIHADMVQGYHVANIIIHYINCILMFLLSKTLLDLPQFKKTVAGRYGILISLIVSLLFAVHPVQTNAVTYIVQRTAALATLFYMLAIYQFIKFRITGQWKHYIIMILSIVCAMYTKENTFTLPFMILLTEIMFFPHAPNKIKVFLPIMMTLAIIPGTNLVLHGYNYSDPSNSIKASTGMDRTTYLLTQFSVIMVYLRLLLVPVNQNLDYDFPLNTNFFELPVILNFSFLVILFITSIVTFKKNKFLSFGILWFFIALSVESSFISIRDVIFEHRLYLAFPGYCFFLIGIISFFRKKRIIPIFVAIFIILIPLYSGATMNRNYIFSDKVRLWADIAEKSPNKSRPHSVLGANYMDYSDKLDLAQKELEISLKLDSSNDTALTNLTKVYYLQGKYDLAIETGEKAHERCASVYTCNNLASAWKKKGDTAKAIEYYLKGYEIDKKCTFILLGLGDTYYEQNDYVHAKKYYTEFLENNRYEKDNEEVRKKLEAIK